MAGVAVFVVALVVGIVLSLNNNGGNGNNNPPATVLAPPGEAAKKMLVLRDTVSAGGTPVIQLTSSTGSFDGTNPVLIYWNVTNSPSQIFFVAPPELAGNVINNSSRTVSPQYTTTYTMGAITYVTGGQTVSATPVSITITSQQPPKINSFLSNAPSTGVGANTPVTFSWNVSLADTIQLSCSDSSVTDLNVTLNLQQDPTRASSSITTSQLSASPAPPPPQTITVTMVASKQGVATSATQSVVVTITAPCPTLPTVPYNYSVFPFGTVSSFSRVAFSSALNSANASCPSIMYGLSSNANATGIYASLDAFAVTQTPATQPIDRPMLYSNMAQFGVGTVYTDICTSSPTTATGTGQVLYAIIAPTYNNNPSSGQPSQVTLFSFAVSTPDVFNRYLPLGATPLPLPTASPIAFTPTVLDFSGSGAQLNSLETCFFINPTLLPTTSDYTGAIGLGLVGQYNVSQLKAPVYGVFVLVSNPSGSGYVLRLYRTLSDKIIRYVMPTINDPNEYSIIFSNGTYSLVLVDSSNTQAATEPSQTITVPAAQAATTLFVADLSRNGYQTICAQTNGSLGYMIGQPYPPFQYNVD